MNDAFADLAAGMGRPRGRVNDGLRLLPESGAGVPPLRGEVLPPTAEVPAAVRHPRIVEAYRCDRDMSVRIRLTDGGVWAFDMFALARTKSRPGEFNGEMASALFADGALRFVERLRPRRVRA